MGAAAVCGGIYLNNKYKLTDPETWKNFKTQGMNFINGIGQQKQGMLYERPMSGLPNPFAKSFGGADSPAQRQMTPLKTPTLGTGLKEGVNFGFSPVINGDTGKPYEMTHPEYADGTKIQRDGIVPLAQQQNKPIWDRIRHIFGAGPMQTPKAPPVPPFKVTPEMLMN